MASRRDSFEITGVTDVKQLLEEVAPKHARNLLRSTTHGVAGVLARMSKENAQQYKDTGELIRSIKTRRRKSPPDAPVSEVYVLPKAYYWRFVEYGTGAPLNLPERPVFRKAEQDIRAELPRIITEQFAKKLESLMKREAKKRGN